MFRASFYNEGGMNTLVPVGRQPVVAGQSVSLDISTHWQTPPDNGPKLSGGIMALYAFYVPHRLVWSGWMDFIAQDGATAPPVASINWPLMFEGKASARSVQSLYRRSFKLVFNEFFGSPQFNRSYADVTDDNYVQTISCRTTDQFLSHVMEQEDAPDPTYVAPVSGSSATISLNDFRQAMRNAQSTRRADMTGDKYVDAMQRMGVSLDWRVQNAPEFLGSVKKEFWPSKVVDQSTGKMVCFWEGDINLKVGRRFFAEHGYIVTVALCRMHSMSADIANADPYGSPQDAYMKTLQHFWMGDNDAGVQAVIASTVSAGSLKDGYSPRFAAYKWGSHNMGQHSKPVATFGEPWAITGQPANLADAVFPNVSYDIPLIGREFPLVTMTTYRADGPSPIRTHY